MQKICVLIVYRKKQKRYLWESISSVELASFFSNVEIDILIGFNGEVETEILAMVDQLKRRCKRCRLEVFTLPRAGIADTLNSLIDMADCDFIARQDCDSMALPMRFKSSLEFMDCSNEISFIGTQAIRINQLSQPLRVQKTYPTSMLGQMIYSTIYNNPISPTTLFVRRCVFNTATRYQNIDDAEDWHLYNDLWLKGYKSHTLEAKTLLSHVNAKDMANRILKTKIRRNEQLSTLKALKASHPLAYGRYNHLLRLLGSINSTLSPIFIKPLHKINRE